MFAHSIAQPHTKYQFSNHRSHYLTFSLDDGKLLGRRIKYTSNDQNYRRSLSIRKAFHAYSILPIKVRTRLIALTNSSKQEMLSNEFLLLSPLNYKLVSAKKKRYVTARYIEFI